MGVLSKGTDFTNGDQVTDTSLDNLVDNATFTTSAVDEVSTDIGGSGSIIVKDGGITTGKLANSTGAGDGVTTAKIATSAVTAAKIGTGAVTKAKIENLTDYTVLGNVSGGAAAPAEVTILDEDTLVTDSATALATQQSIKAYVDAAAATALEIYHVRDEQTSGTNAGTNIAGVNVRVLNTEVYAGITGASLSSNQITLPAGTYRVWATGTLYNVSDNNVYIYNVTDSVDAVRGSNSRSDGTSSANAFLEGVFTIGSTKVFELRHYMASAVATFGLGITASDGKVEIYAQAMFTKLA